MASHFVSDEGGGGGAGLSGGTAGRIPVWASSSTLTDSEDLKFASRTLTIGDSLTGPSLIHCKSVTNVAFFQASNTTLNIGTSSNHPWAFYANNAVVGAISATGVWTLGTTSTGLTVDAPNSQIGVLAAPHATGGAFQITDGTSTAVVNTTSSMLSVSRNGNCYVTLKNRSSSLEFQILASTLNNHQIGTNSSNGGSWYGIVNGSVITQHATTGLNLGDSKILALATSSGGAGTISSTAHATKGTIQFGGASTGMFLDEANSRLIVGSATNNTTAPGRVQVRSSGGTPYIAVDDGTTHTILGCASTLGWVGTLSAHNFAIRTTNTDRVTFNSATMTLASGISMVVTNGGITIGGGGVTMAGRNQQAMGANVASAATITLGIGNYYVLTGSTAVDYITTSSWQAGTEITLRIPSGLTLNHASGSPGGGTAKMRLAGAANLVAGGSGTLVRLVYDGTDWVQCAGKVDL